MREKYCLMVLLFCNIGISLSSINPFPRLLLSLHLIHRALPGTTYSLPSSRKLLAQPSFCTLIFSGMYCLIRSIRSLSLKETPNIKVDIFELPTEVRLTVYRHILRSGERDILGTSKFIRTEALPPVFYVHTGYASSKFVVPPYPNATDAIQSLRIRVLMHGGPKHPVNHNLIKYFGGSEIKRKLCEIILDLGRQQPFFFLDRHEDPPIFGALSTLTGFEKLYVHTRYLNYKMYVHRHFLQAS